MHSQHHSQFKDGLWLHTVVNVLLSSFFCYTDSKTNKPDCIGGRPCLCVFWMENNVISIAHNSRIHFNWDIKCMYLIRIMPHTLMRVRSNDRTTQLTEIHYVMYTSDWKRATQTMNALTVKHRSDAHMESCSNDRYVFESSIVSMNYSEWIRNSDRLMSINGSMKCNLWLWSERVSMCQAQIDMN